MSKRMQTWMGVAIAGAAVLVLAYVYVYWFVPFPGIGNDLFISILLVAASAFGSILATLIFLWHQPGDAPRMIWRNFMISMWLWTAGELIWSIYLVTAADVPTPSLADAAWILGYVFVTPAIYHQFATLPNNSLSRARWQAVAVWVAGLLVLWAALFITRTPITGASVLDYFYPVADCAVGLCALLLMRTFRGGIMSRPWTGLFVFGASDLLYAWAQQSSLYTFSLEAGSPLSLVVDVTYLIAYLLLGLGFLQYYLLLNYGPASR